MKKLLIISLCFTIFFAFSACQKGQEKPDFAAPVATSSDDPRFEDPMFRLAENLKPAIENWLEENEDTVNEYGDVIGTPPPPVSRWIDKGTGRRITLYEYILKRHPDLIVEWGQQINQ